ncbi:MAG: tetratricopeptide repeat protein [Roseobacter sp.]|jgi:Flp pilus assembly protein TadD|nr:tetratricopeptide repeat protein [Roseobacter sp.]
MTKTTWRALRLSICALALVGLAACDVITGGSSADQDQVMAPGVDVEALANKQGAPSIEAGHRLVAAGEFDLALDAFSRAALERGKLDAEILAGMGTANLGLGRLGQAEALLKRAIEETDAQPVDFNNYAVLLMEKGRTSEAVGYFRRAFALSNGENIAIRDNLRLALAKSEISVTQEEQKPSEYKLVRRGNSDYVIRPTP